MCRLLAKEQTSWLPSLVCVFCLPLIWSSGYRHLERALRVLPRLMYHMNINHWKLLVVDAISKHVARFTAFAATLILVNLAVVQIPGQFYFRVHRPLAAADSEPLFISGLTIAHAMAPLLRNTMFAMICTLLACIVMTLRDPPVKVGSHHFRIYPVSLRDPQRPVRATHQTATTAPSLQLYKNRKAIDMPRPIVGADGILVWSFENELVIDEYTWITPKVGEPEDDPVMWRLEGLSVDVGMAQRRWHGVHETDTAWTDVVPRERGLPLGRRFIAPDGTVSADSGSWLGMYYRALQHPQEDRDFYASMVLVRHLLLPLAVGLGFIPWLPVFNIRLQSMMGLTSFTSIAAGVALSLAKSEVLENMFAGMLLSAQGQLIHGDEVEIRYTQAGRSSVETKGRVVSIGNAFVSLNNEGRLLQVPNRIVLGSVISTTQTERAPSAAQASHRSDASLQYLSRVTPSAQREREREREPGTPQRETSQRETVQRETAELLNQRAALAPREALERERGNAAMREALQRERANASMREDLEREPV